MRQGARVRRVVGGLKQRRTTATLSCSPSPSSWNSHPTGAQRIDFWRGDASHLSSNSAAANPPTAAVRLSCNEHLRPDQAKAASLIVEKRVGVDNHFGVRLDDPSDCFGAETIVAREAHSKR
jgi:hypothetical protein